MMTQRMTHKPQCNEARCTVDLRTVLQCLQHTRIPLPIRAAARLVTKMSQFIPNRWPVVGRVRTLPCDRSAAVFSAADSSPHQRFIALRHSRDTLDVFRPGVSTAERAVVPWSTVRLTDLRHGALSDLARHARVAGLPKADQTGLLPLMPRLVVIGAGLLGGSLLASLQSRRACNGGSYVLTAVSSAATRDALQELGWCDAVFGYAELADACTDAELIVLCTPLSAIHDQINAIAACADRLAPGAIVTDVGSTKVGICRQGFAAFPDRGTGSARFVGGHPMAGSEKSGLGAADPLLYQSALWVLCPPADLDTGRLETLKAMVHAVGARVAMLEPDLHDAAVARISHVPQVLASALAGWAGADDDSAEAALALAAGGFRDMTRLALSPWEIWRDILATNAAPVADGLYALSERLAQLAAATRQWSGASETTSPDADGSRPSGEILFRTAFANGKAFRERFRMPRKGIVHDLTELVVRLEDRPGQLQTLFTPLADEGINVQDLEILKVREGESGTILLGFATPEDAHRATRAITAAGFSVTSR